MKRVLPSLLVLTVVASFALPTTARAWLIMVDFSVLADPNDPVHRGETASGSFTFDSGLIQSPFPGVPWSNWRTTGWHIPSLSFPWDEHEWTTLNADLVGIGTDANGDFYSWGIGGKPNGLNALYGGPDFWVTPFSFYYGTEYGGTFFGTTTHWTSSPVQVHEPRTLVLLGFSLLALGAIRRLMG